MNLQVLLFGLRNKRDTFPSARWGILRSLPQFILLLTALLYLCGTDIVASIKLSLYLFVIVAPIGSVVAERFFYRSGNEPVDVIFWVALGTLLHPVSVLPFWYADLVPLHFWLCALSALLIILRRLGIFRGLLAIVQEKRCDQSNGGDWVSICGSVLIALTCFLAVSDTTTVLAHFRVQAIAAGVVSLGWPMENPYVAGIPYRDNFAVHLSIATISDSLGISIPEMGGYIAQVFYLWIAILTFYALCRIWLKLSPAISFMALLSAYFVVGFSPVGTFIFGSAQPTSGLMTLSPLLGSIGYLISLFYLSHQLNDTERKTTITCMVFMGILGFSTMFGRANAGALLGLVFFCFCAVNSIRLKRIFISSTAYCVSGVFGALFALVLALGVPNGKAFTGTGFISIDPVATLGFFNPYNNCW